MVDKKQCEEEVYYHISYMVNWIKDQYFQEFPLKTRLDWSARRVAHRGGINKNQQPTISMAMKLFYLKPHYEINRLWEYPSFDSDPYIGGFYYDKREHLIKAFVAHELAHAVQFFSNRKSNKRIAPHGREFKRHYKELREEFVNTNLPCQRTLKEQYDRSRKNLCSLGT